MSLSIASVRVRTSAFILVFLVLVGIGTAQVKKEQDNAKQKVAGAQGVSTYRPWMYCVFGQNAGLEPLQQYLNGAAKGGFELVGITPMPDATRKNSAGVVETMGRGCSLYILRRQG